MERERATKGGPKTRKSERWRGRKRETRDREKRAKVQEKEDRSFHFVSHPSKGKLIKSNSRASKLRIGKGVEKFESRKALLATLAKQEDLLPR